MAQYTCLGTTAEIYNEVTAIQTLLEMMMFCG